MSKLTCKVIGKRCYGRNEFGRRCALVRGHAEPECSSEPKPGTSVGPISIFVVSLLALMLAGCFGRYELGNRVEIRTDDAYSSTVADTWIAKAREGMAMWRLDGCLDAFPESGGAEPSLVITLYTPSSFPHGAGIIGYTPTDDVVDVKGPDVDHELGLMSDIVGHELGHVLGIEHNTDRTSIMYERSDGASVPNARDIRAARNALGCD